MYKQRISYADYVEEVERLYKIERREIYFGFVIRDFIQSILTESEQLVAVWDNKGYKDDTKNQRTECQTIHERNLGDEERSESE